jgi:uncharacterized membrane protein
MGEYMTLFAVALAMAGVTAALAHFFTYFVVRPQVASGPSPVRLVDRNQLAASLIASLAAYWIGLGVGHHGWWPGSQLMSVALMFGIAACGFAAIADWAEPYVRRALPPWAPVAAAAVLGLATGVAGLS